MHRYLTRACVAAAAGVALSTVGMSGASASSAEMAQAAAGPGAQLWAKLYNGPGNSSSQAFSVTTSPDGSTVYVTGGSGDNGTADYTTVAYNAATGAQRWVSRYNGGVTAFSVAVSPDGSTVFVTGYSAAGTQSGFDYATVAYNAATGAQRWAKLYSGLGNEGGQAFWLAVSPDGKTVFVTGASGVANNDAEDYATVAYNAATGAQRWAKRYNGPGNSNDYAESVAVSPTGNEVFVTGYSAAGPQSSYDYATVAYSAATGAQLWAKRYNGPINSGSTAYSVAVSPDGKTVFVTGDTRNAASGSDFATVAYDAATGAQLWVKLYNGGGFSGNNPPKLVAVSPDGKTVFVTGDVAGPSYDYATVAYNAATGAQLWAKRYDGPGHNDDVAESVAVSPTGGTVYVTGYSDGVNLQPDYATVAYNTATGARLWVSRYNIPNNTAGAVAFSVTVSPSGTVFVTGETHPSSTSNWEYATIAYHS